MKERLEKILYAQCRKTPQEANERQLYAALLTLTKEEAKDRECFDGRKKLYYISAEFLIGKLLSNNLINLGLYEEAEEWLQHNGHSIAAVEEAEPEPSLGNGGLGRLAACFLDSIATLGLTGDGIGLNYHFGLFKQEFRKNAQKEKKNPWMEKKSWLTKTDTVFQVAFGKREVTARMYDIDVTGYQNKGNKLHLFDIETVDETIVRRGIDFDKEDIEKNLTLFLYPDDSDEAGRLLRIYQQYFMVSSGAQLILAEAEAKGSNFKDLDEYAVIQINDTHPTMVIPELIRLLKLKGLTMDEAIQVVRKTCAYTNHTILSEALEKWPLSYLEKVVPQLVPIIKELDKRVKPLEAGVRKEYGTKRTVAIIDSNKLVHMAHICIHYGFSVNGVAALHTEILEKSELRHFYDIYPEKFNNKTNGITFRRWLLHCNRELTKQLRELIGEGFQLDASELSKLGQYKNDKAVLAGLLSIKQLKKRELKEYLEETAGVLLDENAIFDIQIKRLHEYKRQQMNALYIIYKYLEIKSGRKPVRPITFLFGAKAAPAYIIAKDIIHLILCLQQLIAEDPEVSPYLKVFMVENYNVSAAQKLIPACDVSEQISLASKEASGTGNMKFMLNGAVTLGTMDGANVEIHDLVGKENIYIFGESSDQVIAHYEKADYHAREIMEADPEVKKLVDFIVGPQLMKVGTKKYLMRLHKEIVSKDWFMALLDLKDYIRVKEQMFADYEDREAWAEKMLMNISKAGFFSSDRTILQYNEDIWHLEKQS